MREMSLKEILKIALQIKYMDLRAYRGSVISDEDFLDMIITNLKKDPEDEISQLEKIYTEYLELFKNNNC